MHEKIAEVRKNLINKFCEYMDDIHHADTEEVGEIVDILKDLAEMDYYETVSEAMAGSRYDDILGYTPNVTSMMMRTPGRDFTQSMVGDRMRRDYGDFSRGESSGNSRYGQAYQDYEQAKRYYTESHSDKDMQKMRMTADQHIADMIASVRDIWYDADPEHKKQMKADLTAFVNQLAV